MNLSIISTTLSQANQTAVPSKVRKLLGIKPKDKIVWEIEPGQKSVRLKTLPLNLGTYMKGLGKGLWSDVDITSYIQDERQDR